MIIGAKAKEAVMGSPDVSGFLTTLWFFFLKKVNCSSDPRHNLFWTHQGAKKVSFFHGQAEASMY